MAARDEQVDADASPRRRFTDPLRGRAPALERCLIRHRALQMILIIYHAEELKSDVIDGVAAQRRWRGDPPDAPTEDGDAAKQGKRQKRAFDYLVRNGVLSAAERAHMVALIGRRNGIAHHLDQVTADRALERTVREWLDYFPNRQTHDYAALGALRAARRLVSDRMAEHHYMLEVNLRGMFFETTERVLSADLKALEHRIRALVRKRRSDIGQLNGELSLAGLYDPRWPDNRYGERQRLTPRGVETCYLLFDMGKSALAVAHIMELSLASARRRERLWRSAGAAARAARPFADIPQVRRRYRVDD